MTQNLKLIIKTFKKTLLIIFSFILTVSFLFSNNSLQTLAATFIENSNASFNGSGQAGLAWDTPNNGYGTNALNPNSSLLYNSTIKDSGSTATTWNNLAFTSPMFYNAELASNSVNEFAQNSAGINMTDNIAYYKFNEVPPFVSTSTWTDFSGNGNNGVCGPICPDSSTDSVFTRSLQNNNQVNKLLVLPNGASIQGRSKFSISFWMKFTSTAVSKILYEEAVGGTSSNARLRISMANTNLRFEVRNTDAAATTTLLLQSTKFLAINIWYHTSFVFDSVTDVHKIYVNGNPESATVPMNAFPATTNSNVNNGIKIANSVTMSTGTKFNGRFDEFTIFGRDLSQLEIQKMYARGRWKITFLARSCANNTCTGSTLVGPTGSAATPFSQLNNPVFPSNASFPLNQTFFPPNRYFQFQITFVPLATSTPLAETNVQSYMNSVTIDYTPPTPVTPVIDLAFAIRNATDTADTNTCDIGTASLTTTQTCSYRLKVSTSNSTGYFVFVATNTGLRHETFATNITDSNTGTLGGNLIDNTTAGTERYGIKVTPGAITGTGSITASSDYNSANSVKLNTLNVSELMLTSNADNVPTGISQQPLIEHNLNISSATDAGNYTQNVTYTVVLKF